MRVLILAMSIGFVSVPALANSNDTNPAGDPFERPDTHEDPSAPSGDGDTSDPSRR